MLGKSNRDLKHIRRRRRGRRLVKMCFYFTLEFDFYLDLFSVLPVLKLASAEHATNGVQFQIEIRKISRCGSRSPDNAEFGHFTPLLFSRGRKRNLQRITRAQPFFFSLNLLFRDVFAAVVFRVWSRKASNDSHPNPSSDTKILKQAT